MKTSFVILIILAALATLAALVMGVITMARGKDMTGERSNKLMSYRVMFQAITILLVGVLLYAMRAG
jgi:Hypoxia induced protein conserved region